MAAEEEQPDGAGDVYGLYSAETSAFPLNKPSARGASEGLPKKWGPGWGQWRCEKYFGETINSSGWVQGVWQRSFQNPKEMVMASTEMDKVWEQVPLE